MNTTREIGATLLRECPLALRLVRRDCRGLRPRLVRGGRPEADAVDFAARHFRPDPSIESREIAELTASAQGYRSYVAGRSLRSGAIWPGRSSGWASTTPGAPANEPDSFDAWKILGQIELFRELPSEPARDFALRSTRFSICRWFARPTALRRALELAPTTSRRS